jgi:hypothetical protein
MKKKIIISVVALMLFAFSIAAFAYTNHTTNHNSKTSCCQIADCCKDGVCKMNHECCKDKDSCPMKSNSEAMKDCPMHNDKTK